MFSLYLNTFFILNSLLALFFFLFFISIIDHDGRFRPPFGAPQCLAEAITISCCDGEVVATATAITVLMF